MAKICIDCNCRLKNRSKSTKRCRACDLIKRHNNAKGRIINIFCKKCGKELSFKKTTSYLCRNCYVKTPFSAWNKDTKGICKAWNKGKSNFQNKEEYRIHKNKLRLLRYYKLTTKEKIADNIRTLIRNSLKQRRQLSKKCKTIKLLGCNIFHFIKYLELLFEPKMNWSNYGNGYGKWNIDHIKPISSFKNLHRVSEQKKAFNFRNCQPMWAINNIKKGGSNGRTEYASRTKGY